MQRTLTVLLAGAMVFAGCGSEDSKADNEPKRSKKLAPVTTIGGDGETPAKTLPSSPLTDPAGDAEDGNYKRYPQRGDLDVRKVTLDAKGENLQLVMSLAKPPVAKSRYYYGLLACGSDGNGCTQIEVRREQDGTLDSTYYDIEDTKVQPFDSSVRFEGSSLLVTIPVDILTTKPPFNWSVRVSDRSTLEIIDAVPDNSNDVTKPAMASFDG